jgi:hypothetical protein
MGEAVYLLCALTSIGCAILLVRSYRRSRTSLLLWSSVCFVGLAVNNLLLFADLVLFKTQVDLALPRALTGFFSIAALLVGLVWSDGE